MSPIALLLMLLACTPTAEPEEAGNDDHEEGSEVSLTPEAVAAARLVIEPAEERRLATDLVLQGRIDLDPRKQAVISAWISGQVDVISVQSGEDVKKGQRLATVQSPELGEAIAAFRGAKALDDASDARLERLRRLETDGVAAHAQVLDAEAEHAGALGALEAAEERLRILGVDPTIGDPHAGEHFPSHVPVRSPISGKVLTADASVGARVEPGDELFRVGDLGEVWLILNVYERDLSAVTVEQTVKFSVAAWPSEAFEGRVLQVGDWVEPEARTIEVRVLVPNPDHRLKPNMFAEARLSGSASGDVGIVLPAQAVEDIEGKSIVFVQEQLGHFEAREVTVATRSTTHVLLSAGIEVGEPVVVDGAFALKSELAKGELGHGHAH